MSCDFCKTIWSSEEEYKKYFSHPWNEEDAIVMFKDEPWLYTTCGDYYYNGVLMPISYCPVCGRKIT